MKIRVPIQWVIAIGTIATAVIVYGGGSFLIGKAVENTMRKQYQWLSQSVLYTVKQREYEFGWFSSFEKTTLTINPEIVRFFLEKEGQTLPAFEVTYTHHIRHGPLPLIRHFNFHPYKAVVETQLSFSPETQKKLKKFFGDRTPVQIENRIDFSDNGKLMVKIPPFNYEEALSKTKAQWQGMVGTLHYGGDFKSIQAHFQIPGFDGQIHNKGNLRLSNFGIQLDRKQGLNGLMLGIAGLNLGKLSFTSKKEDGAPFSIDIDQLLFNNQVQEAKEFIDADMHIKLAQLTIDKKRYAPIEWKMTANHLYAPTLLVLSQKIGELRKEHLEDNERSEAMLQFAQSEGIPLLTHDPRLVIQKFQIQSPEGIIRLSAELGLNDFKEADLKTQSSFLSKLNVKVDLTLPRTVLESIAFWKARDMFGDENSNISSADLEYLTNQFVQGQINQLVQQNLIRLEGKNLSTTLSVKNGQFMLNNTVIPMPWDLPSPKE